METTSSSYVGLPLKRGKMNFLHFKALAARQWLITRLEVGNQGDSLVK